MTNSEINEAVARKLGWKLILDEGAPHFICPKCPKAHISNPDWCGSIEAAWEIVDGITKYRDDWWCALRYKPLIEKENGGKWDFIIVDGKTNDQIEVVAATAPLAICLAFLKLEDK